MGDFLSGLGGGQSYSVAQPYGTKYSQTLADQMAQLYAQQQGLAGQLQGVASGNGPNPAQGQYMQNVQNNVANAQGLISSQRGLNPALAAKIGANLGAQANQQAAAQSGVMQGQQQLGAMGALGNLYGQTMQGQLQQQQNVNNANNGSNSINANQASQAAGRGTQLLGGLLSGGATVAAAGLAHGGEVGAQPDFLSQVMGHLNMAHGGKVPAMVSPGEIYLSPEKARAVAQGKMSPMKAGEKIKGKAEVAGDSLENDTVPKKLEKGGVVVPRSAAQGKGSEDKARAFVQAILARENLKKGKKNES